MKLFAKLKGRNRILLFLAVFIVAILGYYNLFYLSHLKEIKALRKDNANLEAILKTIKEAGVTTVDSSVDKFRLKLREREFSKLKKELGQAEERLLEKGDLADYLSELTSLCSQCKIEVAFFAPHPEKELNSGLLYQGLPLELNVRTTWHDIVNFLEKLQRLPDLATLKDIELTVDKERPPYINGKLILQLWLKD